MVARPELWISSHKLTPASAFLFPENIPPVHLLAQVKDHSLFLESPCIPTSGALWEIPTLTLTFRSQITCPLPRKALPDLSHGPCYSLLGNQGQKLGCVQDLSFAHDGMGWALLGVCCVPASQGSPGTE